MSVFPIKISGSVTEEQLKKGSYLFIYRASRIPPHIGILTNGLLYDITAVGPNIDLPITDFYKTSVKRKMEVLFVELNLPIVETNSIASEQVKKYWKVNAETSCLAPVKDFLLEVSGVELNEATFLFDLLPILDSQNMIAGVYELNLQKKIKDDVFNLITYTQEDIANCIAALGRKEKATC